MGAEIWVFCSEDDMTRTRPARALLRKIIGPKNWVLQERVAKSVRTPSGGLLHVADPRDVVALYRQAHRSAVALLVSGSIRFCTEPPEDRAIRRELTLKLLRHCQYKAYCGNFPENEGDRNTFIAGFDGWLNTINCDGDTDARCLPFPIFKAQIGFNDLASPAYRAAFDVAHHNGNVRGRLDGLGLSWETNPRDYHGHETLTVAGRALSRGFHWDVQNDNRKPKKLGSPTEIWQVQTYVNVFPDGKIAGRHPYARKIFG